MKRLTLIFFLFLSCLSLKAQFSLTGSGPVDENGHPEIPNHIPCR